MISVDNLQRILVHIRRTGHENTEVTTMQKNSLNILLTLFTGTRIFDSFLMDSGHSRWLNTNFLTCFFIYRLEKLQSLETAGVLDTKW